MIPRVFLRMSRLARRRPSEQQAKLVFGVIALCVLLGLVEWLVGWPEGLKPQSLRF